MPLTSAYNLRAALYGSIGVIWLVFILSSCSESPQRIKKHELLAVDVATIKATRYLTKLVQVTTSERNSTKTSELGKLSINDSFPDHWRVNMGPENIQKDIFYKFRLTNSADSVHRVYFYPGSYFTDIQLYKIDSIQPEKPLLISPLKTEPEYRLGFRLLDLQPAETSTFVAKLQALKSTANTIQPAIVQKPFIEMFIYGKMNSRRRVEQLTFVVTGIMLMMILYSLAVYIQSGNSQFLYYSAYALCFAILLFLKSFMVYTFTSFNFFFESYWDFIIQCLGVYFYFLFLSTFLDTRNKHPFIHRVLRIGNIIIGGSLVIYSLLFFLTDNFTWLNFFENFAKQILLLIGVIFVIYGFRKKDTLLRFMVWGNIILITFSLMSFLIIVTRLAPFKAPGLQWMNSAIVYYEVGLVAELTLFLIGLAYKNKLDIISQTTERERLRIENERKELEKQMAVLEAKQDERNRISADMHDELGSGVTAIRLMSEIVKSKMKNETLPEIDKISNSANDLITKMNTIIWTMTSSNDTAENLVTYIRTYAVEFFENSGIDCIVNLPQQISKIELSGERRRNVFLAVKEALNNIVKHSGATRIEIDMQINDKLTITIKDNGQGIDFDNIRQFGNGLKNMKKRIEGIGGTVLMQNENGCRIIYELNLAE